MTKPAKKPDNIPDFGPTPKAAAPKPLTVPVTQQDVDRAIQAQLNKLGRAIVNAPHDGEIGAISKLVADLRSLDLLNPGKVQAPRDTVTKLMPDGSVARTTEDKRQLAEIAERQAAAADQAKMQAFNAKVAKAESMQAAREESE
jgi:hypothetical protein